MGIITRLSLTTIVLACLVSCTGTKNDDIDLTEGLPAETENAIDSTKISAQNVFNSIPARSEIVSLVSGSKAEYDPALPSNPDDVNKYSVESSKALNLGVYGADLSASGVYEQTQESMLYLKCVNILAKNLGVSSAFDEKMTDRMEANKENRDSTLEIISQSFKKADNFLKANGRPGTSSLIVAGAWIEAMHMACKTAAQTKYEPMIKAIFAQQESLTHLIELLEHSKVSEDARYVTSDLSAIKSLLEAKTDKAYTPESLRSVAEKVSALRQKVITTN